MKRWIGLCLALCLVFTVLCMPGAYALNYCGVLDNEATFETLEEARLSAPAAIEHLETNEGRMFVSHPVLDGYPENSTYIYRSAHMYGGRAAARLNTNLLVFVEQHFDSKDNALACLRDLGLIDIIDRAVGSVILVTPANGKSFGAADQKNYYALQTAICAQKVAGVDSAGNRVTYAEGEYYGGYGYIYMIGLDGGATFINNYLAGVVDYIGRIAGMLLINGTMDPLYSIASLVPVYLVNAEDKVVEKYKAANAVDASEITPEADVYFNQARTLQRVVVAKTEKSVAEYIHAAYSDLFIHAMRVPVAKTGLQSASTLYQGYSGDASPYSLCDRNPVFGDVTADGIHVIEKQEEFFSDIKAEDGEYLQTWFEYLPEEVLDGTAYPGTIPLIVATHGTNDDPRLFVDEIGLLSLAGKERLAVVATEHQYLAGTRSAHGYSNSILTQAIPKLLAYLLNTYPALDPSRVYIMGYSKGGSVTLQGISGSPEMFAAAVPMAVPGYDSTEEEDRHFDSVDLPIMFMTSSYDMPVTQPACTLGESYQLMINRHLAYNEMDQVTFDFEAYPVVGFRADKITTITLNGEYRNITWLKNNDAGIPMVGVSLTEKLVHALYPEYAKVAWNFAKHYSRNQDTFEIVYDPYVD